MAACAAYRHAQDAPAVPRRDLVEQRRGGEVRDHQLPRPARQQVVGEERQHHLLRERARPGRRDRHAVGIDVEQEPGIGAERAASAARVAAPPSRAVVEGSCANATPSIRSLIRMNSNPCRSFMRRRMSDGRAAAAIDDDLESAQRVEIERVAQVVQVMIERARFLAQRPDAHPTRQTTCAGDRCRAARWLRRSTDIGRAGRKTSARSTRRLLWLAPIETPPAAPIRRMACCTTGVDVRPRSITSRPEASSAASTASRNMMLLARGSRPSTTGPRGARNAAKAALNSSAVALVRPGPTIPRMPAGEMRSARLTMWAT